ncbi:MAG: hypothetical protein IPF83_04925 [Rhodanobacteraceae bacterium]|nr:hypothetical protein [Rhodanobacteraceae bacterium]
MTLRWRATLAFTLLGALLSVLFVGATVFIAEDYEHVIVDEILRGQAEDYDLRLSSTAEAVLPRTHRLSGYCVRPMDPGKCLLTSRHCLPAFTSRKTKAKMACTSVCSTACMAGSISSST